MNIFCGISIIFSPEKYSLIHWFIGIFDLAQLVDWHKDNFQRNLTPSKSIFPKQIHHFCEATVLALTFSLYRFKSSL